MSTTTDRPNAADPTNGLARDAEIREIGALAETHAMQDKLPEWIAKGTALEGKDGVRAQIAATLKERLDAGPQTRPRVALTEKEQRKYSYARAIVSALDGTPSYERDLHEDIAKKLPTGYKPQGGFFLPTTIAYEMDGTRYEELTRQRGIRAAGLDSGTSTKGAELKYTQYGGFIDMLRNRARVLQAGARMLQGLDGPVTFTKQNGAGTFAWVGENPGSDVAESNLLLTTVSLSAKTGQSTTSYSRQLLRQAVEDVEALVRDDLAMIHALGIDAGALFGSGSSNQPTGIYNQSGVGVVALGTNGAAPTYANLINQQVQVAQANAAALGEGAYITTPGMKGTLQTTTKLANSIAQAIWSDNDTIANKAAFETNQVQSNLTKGTGSNLHAVYYGIWQQLLIGEWGAMEILVDPLRLKKQGMIEVTSFQMIDIAVRYAAAFSLIKDAISSF